MSPGNKDKNCRVLAMVHADVPCNESLLVTGKTTAIPITVLKVLSAGFGMAPYSMAKPGARPNPIKADETAEPLFKMINDIETDGPPSMELWSYIGKGMNREPRQGGLVSPEDSTKNSPPLAKISTGSTFIFFCNNITFANGGAATTLPTDLDWLPAFSLVENLIAPRNMASVVGGRMINVKSMRPSTSQYDSLFQNGFNSVGLSTSVEQAQRISAEKKEIYPAMSKDLENEKCCFMVDGTKLVHAYTGIILKIEIDRGDDTDMAALCNPPQYMKICVGNMAVFSESDYVDVPLGLMTKLTNTISTEHGAALLDVAFALGAVDLIVTFDSRWSNSGSCYRAVPVITTNIMFGVVKNIRSIEDGYVKVAVGTNGVSIKQELVKEDTTGMIKMDKDETEQVVYIKLQKEVSEETSDEDDENKESAQILTLRTEIPFDDGCLEFKMKIVAEDTSKTRQYTVKLRIVQSRFPGWGWPVARLIHSLGV